MESVSGGGISGGKRDYEKARDIDALMLLVVYSRAEAPSKLLLLNPFMKEKLT